MKIILLLFFVLSSLYIISEIFFIPLNPTWDNESLRKSIEWALNNK